MRRIESELQLIEKTAASAETARKMASCARIGTVLFVLYLHAFVSLAVPAIEEQYGGRERGPSCCGQRRTHRKSPQVCLLLPGSIEVC